MKKNYLQQMIPLCVLLLSFNANADWQIDQYGTKYWQEALPVELYLPPLSPETQEVLGNVASNIENFFVKYQEPIINFIKDIYTTDLTVRLKYSFAFVGVPLMMTHGIPAMWNLAMHKLMKASPPKIIDNKTKKYGFYDHITWLPWSTNQATSTLIFNDSVKTELDYIERKTNSIRKRIQAGNNTTTYSNLLLYGEAGTGKTSFARALADKANMDFIRVTAGSLLQEGIVGIKHFDSLVDMAKNSKYGLILFIDEADALFGNRSNLHQGTDYYTVLSHILAETGTSNNKFMLVAATNHLPAIDKAMQDRFQDVVEMPLPDEKTRMQLITLYSKKNLSHLNYKNIWNDALISELAKKTEGLSHRKIEFMVTDIVNRTDADNTKDVTIYHIQDAANNAVKKNSLQTISPIIVQQPA